MKIFLSYKNQQKAQTVKMAPRSKNKWKKKTILIKLNMVIMNLMKQYTRPQLARIYYYPNALISKVQNGSR